MPIQFVTVFYIIFALWWIGILLWAAYKLDLWPDSLNPKHVDVIEVDAAVKGTDVIETDGPVELPKSMVKRFLLVFCISACKTLFKCFDKYMCTVQL